MPLAGDVKYGSAVRGCSLALFSCRLAFTHPFTGEKLELTAFPEGEIWESFGAGIEKTDKNS